MSIMHKPNNVENSNMYRFMKKLNFNNYKDLYEYSIEQDKKKDFFWKDVLLHFNVIFEGDCNHIYDKKAFIEYNWFPKLKLNFAENLLNSCKHIYFEHESGKTKTLNKKEIAGISAAFQHYISDVISEKDIVAAYMPNIPETVIAMLGTTALGGVFSSVSCDFGAEGVISRFKNLKPKVLVAAASYTYKNKVYCLKENIETVLREIKSIKKIIIVDFLGFNNCKHLGDEWNFKTSVKKLKFNRVNFKNPLYVMYSSGTTGDPKCIVHSVGGTLLQHIKELGLHCDMTNDKNIFYYTTCGWMMWNWLVSGLFFGKITIYEGACNNFLTFLDIINRKKINIFGTSPKFLKALEKSGYNKNLKLDSLETILSTGSVLQNEQYDFVYDNIKKDVILSSISGGTDILGCFMLGNPIIPVKRGEITCKGLGMDIDVFDDNGMTTNKKGELVCRQSFPSQPIYFLNDPKKTKYKEAYFSKYKGIWKHGDYVQISKDGYIRIFGRSDYTLNPGGIRIGTSEIYGVLDCIEEIVDSICIDFKQTSEIILFVILNKNIDLNILKQNIKQKLTARHVPKYIHQVNYIPYTKSGKKMEAVISKIFNEEQVEYKERLSEYFKIARSMITQQ